MSTSRTEIRARRILSVLLVGLALATFSRPLLAQEKVGTTAAPFLGIGMGARAGAMGGAYVANAQGPSALYWNPAGITQMDRSGVEFSYASWFVDSNVQQAAFVLTMGQMGHVGVSISALNYGEMEVTTIASPDGTGELFKPLDIAVGLSYAKALTDRFSFGGTFKVIRQKIWNESANGLAVDLGVFYRTDFKNLRIGASMTNFGTDMTMAGKDLRQAIDIDPNNEGNNPRLPANLEVDPWAIPLAFRIGLAADVVQNSHHRVTTSVDALHPNDNAESANVGLEYAFQDLIFLRGGFRQAFAQVTDDGGWTLGAGLRYELSATGPVVNFDYVYQKYQAGRLDAPQMFTFGVAF
jgi:hypothetical protein